MQKAIPTQARLIMDTAFYRNAYTIYSSGLKFHQGMQNAESFAAIRFAHSQPLKNLYSSLSAIAVSGKKYQSVLVLDYDSANKLWINHKPDEEKIDP